ncbi:hypothetical protein AVEN_100250-1 [Araneus ventricosus]|uniref:Uncharacterized protein n=1 Tax=Araneus ventricosus TaxID=182803 RepID=A0A4Y2LGX2_ARAVE|nr:hypothetical protein AVEN_100250-1 [Araneus ventricosus]
MGTWSRSFDSLVKLGLESAIIARFYFVPYNLCTRGKTGYSKWLKTGTISIDDSSDEDDENTSDVDCLYLKDVFPNLNRREGLNQCINCLSWAHESCSCAEEQDNCFTCEFCN